MKKKHLNTLPGNKQLSNESWVRREKESDEREDMGNNELVTSLRFSSQPQW